MRARIHVPAVSGHRHLVVHLARDNQICCFGDQNAKPYDLVVVAMREGVTTDYIVDRPFDVIGTFHIEPMMRSDDVFYSMYRIKDATIVDR